MPSRQGAARLLCPLGNLDFRRFVPFTLSLSRYGAAGTAFFRPARLRAQVMNTFLIATLGIGGSTLLGSFLGFFIKGVSHRVGDIIVGLCAGVMLSASTLGLLVPAFDLAQTTREGYAVPLLGMAVGALLLTLLDRVTPHLHSLTGAETECHADNAHIDRVLLFTLALALHKLPEGMAAGVGFADTAMVGNALSVAVAIALQNIPEGLVIISPLLLIGCSRVRAALIALAIGLLEVVGMLVGCYAGSVSQLMLPFMLALSGGAMLYVVSDEMIPESHTHGYQKEATFALLFGFALMLLLERTL